MEHTNEREPPSLLWPARHPRTTTGPALSAQQALDLGIDVLVRALDWDGSHGRYVRTVLMAFVANPAVITYRQSIVAELAANERLRTVLAAVLPQLAELGRPRSAGWGHESPLLLVPPRVSDLELYVACVNELHTALIEAGELHSAGLRAVRDFVAEIRAQDDFRALAAELPTLRAQLDHAASITVGVNLDRDLLPASVTLVSINQEPFVGPRSLAQRLFGRAVPAGTPGLTALRSVMERSPNTDSLARDLQHVLAEVVQPVAAALERYQRIHARPLAALEPEFAFYLGAVQFAQRLAAHGLPTCLPTPAERRHQLNAAYNPVLALQLTPASGNGRPAAPLVLNPIDFDAGRIVFLTGPNRGGKTTYLRAVGLNQLLFQAGIFVAAADATMTPVDAILTHFPPVEGAEPGGGRLDDEARRLREMFAQATSASLLLFNEPLTSTGEREALILASDILRALRLLNARTVYVTHLHALADELDTLNHAGDGATIVSWVAGVDETTARTYHIQPGRPAARSHATLIAQQHNITFEQLARQLAERGIGVASPGAAPTTESRTPGRS